MVNPGDGLVDYLFCEIPPADLSGFVFVDRDADCVFDTGEQPIANTTVTLYDVAGNAVRDDHDRRKWSLPISATCDRHYTVREQQPSGYLQGGQKAGSAGGLTTRSPTRSPPFPSEQANRMTDYNFCEVLPASIHGQVSSTWISIAFATPRKSRSPM